MILGTMIVTNIETVPDRQITASLGVVSGATVRAKHVGRDLLAGIRNVFGGELRAYTELLAEAREEATQRMIAQAQALGAQAIVNVRYATSTVAQGTAVQLADAGARPWRG